MLLQKECIRVNVKRVLRIMETEGLLSAVRRRKYSPETYKLRKEIRSTVPENLLRRDFVSLGPGKKYVTDITYLYGLERILYLCMIEDLWNAEVCAYKIGEHPDGKLCIDTVDILARKTDLKGALLHSDEGSSYIALEYRMHLASLGIIQSCSDRGECWDNAPMESCNGVLKTEALYSRFGKTNVRDRRIPIGQIVEAVTGFIAFYNSRRPKKSLGGLSPSVFREQNPAGTWPALIK